MSKPPWDKDEFTECSDEHFLSAMQIARDGISLSRRYEAVSYAASESEREPFYKKLRPFFASARSNTAEPWDEQPEKDVFRHSRDAIQFLKRVGRTERQKALLAAIISQYLLEEFRGRFAPRDTDLDFYEAATEASLAAELHLEYLNHVPDDTIRTESLVQINRSLDSRHLPKIVGLVKQSVGVDDPVSKGLCERLVAMFVSARFLQYIQTATHNTPNGGMREPLDRETHRRLGLVIRNGGSDALVAMMLGVNIAENLQYEDIKSKSELAEAAVANSVCYLRNTDEFIHPRHISGMRQVVNDILQRRRNNGISVFAERLAQLYRITNPSFISWKLSRVDLKKFYTIVSLAKSADSAPVAI